MSTQTQNDQNAVRTIDEKLDILRHDRNQNDALEANLKVRLKTSNVADVVERAELKQALENVRTARKELNAEIAKLEKLDAKGPSITSRIGASTSAAASSLKARIMGITLKQALIGTAVVAVGATVGVGVAKYISSGADLPDVGMV